MSRILEARTSFNGGELSPLIAARIDVAKFSNGCARMENFLPTTQGPAICRPGTRHVAEVKDSADRTWLMRFERSEDDSYILEWGDGYVRFYTNRGVLLSALVPLVPSAAALQVSSGETVGAGSHRLGASSP